MSSKSEVSGTLFAILRSALGTEKLTSELSLPEEEWRRLYAVCRQQMVGAVVLDELKVLGCKLPEDVLAEWEEYSRFCGSRFDRQLMALTRLSALLQAEGVRMMVLKGVGLALCYPKPELRECGDIDIFCFGDYDRVNGFVVSSGLDPGARETEEKHFGFEVCGVEVENHCKFCKEDNRANGLVGRVLMEMSGREAPMRDPRMPGIVFPSAQMGALHLLSHTLMHLWWSGITLRHLCDVAMFFRRFGDEIDMAELRSVLREAGMERSAALLLGLCRKLLGLEVSGWRGSAGGGDPIGEDGSVSGSGPAGGDASAEEVVLRSIFNPFVNSCYTRDPFRKLYRKVVMHRFRKRLYRLVYGEKYPEKFLESFVCLKGARSFR